MPAGGLPPAGATAGTMWRPRAARERAGTRAGPASGRPSVDPDSGGRAAVSPRGGRPGDGAVTRDGEPPRSGRPGFAGVGYPDARADGDELWRNDGGGVVRS